MMVTNLLNLTAIYSESISLSAQIQDLESGLSGIHCLFLSPQLSVTT